MKNQRQIPATTQVCATCKYWIGIREATHIGAFSIIDPEEKGKCVSEKGNYLIKTLPTSECDKGWVVWSVIARDNK